MFDTIPPTTIDRAQLVALVQEHIASNDCWKEDAMGSLSFAKKC